MSHGKLTGICVATHSGDQMVSLQEVWARVLAGLDGDRYSSGQGSWNKGSQGKRQVTLINGRFIRDSGFTFPETRRNLCVLDVELMDLIGKEFAIGDAEFLGIKYCDPCMRPSKLAGKEISFREAFYDRGGLIAEVRKSGLIRVGDAVVPPKKSY